MFRMFQSFHKAFCSSLDMFFRQTAERIFNSRDFTVIFLYFTFLLCSDTLWTLCFLSKHSTSLLCSQTFIDSQDGPSTSDSASEDERDDPIIHDQVIDSQDSTSEDDSMSNTPEDFSGLPQYFCPFRGCHEAPSRGYRAPRGIIKHLVDCHVHFLHLVDFCFLETIASTSLQQF